MSNLLVILKNSFINNTGINSLANGINGGKEKKKLLFSTFMLIFIGALICFMSTTYSLMMAEALQEIGYLDLLLVMAILVSCMLGLFTSIYKAQGVLFNAKDYDLLMSLPIKNTTILASKIISLMSINFISSALILIPASIVYFRYNGSLSWMYFLILTISLIFVPMIPIVAASIIAVIITFISSRFKHKNIATVIVGMIILLGIMAVSFNSQKYVNEFIANSESIVNGLSSIYPPALYLKNALINIDFISLVKFIIISIIPFMIFIFVFSKTFKIINGKLSETYRRANYKVGSLEEKSILKALMIQELRRYIATPIYIFNTAFAMVLLVAASVVNLFLSREQILVLLGYQGMEDLIPMMALVLMVFTIGLSCTTNSSISLEGNRLWIIKSLPIDTVKIFKGKILMNLIITVPATIISNILLFIGLNYEIKYLIFNLVISLIFSLLSPGVGLIGNLYFPKLDWKNPTVVVKQSTSVFITMVFVMATIGLGIGAVYLFRISNFIMFLSIVAIILLVMLVVGWEVLINQGVTKFKEL